MKKSSLSSFLCLILASIIVLACAKQVALTGGKQDTKPPEVKIYSPENGSTNFAEKHVTVKFNEYIKLNDLASKLIVSPPLEEKPVAVVSGKKLKIKLKPDQLKPNTTYCLNFNDAIADINENNAINSFVYAFSTGEQIDSLCMSGTIFDAFTRKPAENVWVMLHSEHNDTAIATKIPDYITKVDKNGNFKIQYLAEKDYKIYALRDNNSNFKFDLPEEEIAFLDTIFRPYTEISTDTLPADSTAEIKLKTNCTFLPNDIKMLIFRENKTQQFFKSQKRVRRNYFELEFSFTQYEDFSFTVPGDSAAFVWAKENPDTVFLWLKDSTLIASDTLKILAKYTDPAFPDTVHYDTLKFRKQDKLLADTALLLQLAKEKMPFADYELTFSTPIEHFDTAKIKLEIAVDTLYEKIDFSIKRDSLNPLKLKIIADIKEGEKYKITTDSAFATSIYGFVSQANSGIFSQKAESSFGSLKVVFQDEKNYLVELLLNGKVHKKTVVADKNAIFTYILPNKYDIRVTEDSNNNGRWDTGDFAKHLQAEEVFYYPTTYEIRASWEHEIIWDNTINEQAQSIKNK